MKARTQLPRLRFPVTDGTPRDGEHLPMAHGDHLRRHQVVFPPTRWTAHAPFLDIQPDRPLATIRTMQRTEDAFRLPTRIVDRAHATSLPPPPWRPAMCSGRPSTKGVPHTSQHTTWAWSASGRT